MKVNLVTGIIGLLMLVGFLGFMVGWIKALPLIVITGATLVLVLYDFIASLRQGNGGSNG